MIGRSAAGGVERRRSPLVGVLALALIASAAAAAPASAQGSAEKSQPTCRGPAELKGFFALAGKRKLALKKASCGAGRKVAKRFSGSCLERFAAQKACRVRAAGRWRCRTTITGPTPDGVRSRESCRRGRSQVRFQLAYSPPTEPSSFGSLVKARGPFREPPGCVDTSTASTTIPPLAGTSFEVRVSGGVSSAEGTALREALASRSVDSILNAGLGSTPRNAPARIPLYLTPRVFDRDAAFGIASLTCANNSVDGLVVRTNQPHVASTAAHELFHAYSYWGIQKGEADVVPWWEEASATWAEGKVGFPEVTDYDPLLQVPSPLDTRTTPKAYPYAMSRFIQFLEDKGLVGGAGWPLQREVIFGYPAVGSNTGTTQALANALAARGAKLGTELAAFWGDRIRNKPVHGPQLTPGSNARQIEVAPGSREITQPAGRLDTAFINFTLADNVRRVEFEFDPPDDGFFWGAPTETTSRRYEKGESASFCVDSSDDDDLEWPLRFPVTFTNGRLEEGNITGKITVRATTDREQCTGAAPNRACRLLRGAGVSEVLGPGSFPFSSESSDANMRYWLCFYVGSQGEVNFNLARFPGRTPRQVRDAVRRQIAGLGFRRVDNVGDLAGIGVIQGDPDPAVGLVIAMNREIAFLIVGPGTNEGPALRLGRGIAGE